MKKRGEKKAFVARGIWDSKIEAKGDAIMKKRQKRVLAVLLAGALVLAMIPPVAFAEGEFEDAGLADAAVAQSAATAQQDAEFKGLLEADDSAVQDESVPTEESVPAEESVLADDPSAIEPGGELATTPDVSESAEDTPDAAPTASTEDSPESPEASDEETGTLSTMAPGDISIDVAAFPDANFRAWLLDGSHIGGAGADGVLEPSEIAGITEINVGSKSIADLTGIEYFTALEYLYCGGNNLAELPELPSTLRWLSCYGNNLAELPELPAALYGLDCYDNNLIELPSLPSTLEWLQCSDNSLIELPSLPSALEWLDCYNNNLIELPALPAALYGLTCADNDLTELPALPAALSSLYCADNELSELPPLPAALNSLYCGNNNLTELPDLPSTLKILQCTGNYLTELPELPAGLTDLYCYNNNLTELPELPSTLGWLGCYSNNLSELPELPSALESLSCSDNNLTELPSLPNTLRYFYCSNNRLSSLDMTGLNALVTFYGDGQRLTLPLADDGAGTFSAAINLNDPIFGNPAVISYTSGILTSADSSVISTTFTAQTGNPGYTFSGILTLDYGAQGTAPLTISGITMGSKTYDGQPAVYTGNPVLTDSAAGQTVTGIALDVLYESTDGGSYSSSVAPTHAGAYRLTLAVPVGNTLYTGSQTYAFTINKKTVAVRAKNLSVAQDATLPTPLVTYSGFVGGDNEDNALAVKAEAQLSVTDSATAGTSVIGFGTQAALNSANGANYTLLHAVGTLTITAPPEQSGNTSTTNTANDNKDTGTKGSSLPQTGDRESFQLAMLSLVLLAAGFGITGARMTGRLSRRNRG
jgi:Leucine-rich repeat (LRR) protein